MLRLIVDARTRPRLQLYDKETTLSRPRAVIARPKGIHQKAIAEQMQPSVVADVYIHLLSTTVCVWRGLAV
jgi:hypothetical protein